MSLSNQMLSGKYADTAGPEVPSRRENIQDGLKRQLANHAIQSEKIERLLVLLEKNPDFQELLNLTREVGGY